MNTWAGPSWDFSHGDLRVSENGRFLEHADGALFFYLGDTAWELFHRLTREDAERYLENRRAKGFTVIQAVCLAEVDGLHVPNAYGHRPLIDDDPTRPDIQSGSEDYWDHVDWIVDLAAEKGLAIAMLPTWGDKVAASWGTGPRVFTSENARVYAEWLSRRYADRPNLLWVNGGDRAVGEESASIWRAVAAGLRAGDGGRHLITFHPDGRASSSRYWTNEEPWLDFHMLQSGHNEVHFGNHAMIAHDYVLTPTKPVFDGEPRYENHPVDWKPEEKGWFDAHDIREACYWALFAGAFGHAYGCHDIWQFLEPGRESVGLARGDWRQSLDLPGACQLIHARSLMLSRPFTTRVPDQNLIMDGQGDGGDHVQATRDRDGRYAFVYLPTGKPVTIDLDRIRGPRIQAWWYNPRTGEAIDAGIVERSATREFTPPTRGERDSDWVLTLDDASQGYGAPGA